MSTGIVYAILKIAEEYGLDQYVTREILRLVDIEDDRSTHSQIITWSQDGCYFRVELTPVGYGEVDINYFVDPLVMGSSGRKLLRGLHEDIPWTITGYYWVERKDGFWIQNSGTGKPLIKRDLVEKYLEKLKSPKRLIPFGKFLL
jgi:hypothetical protein